jgi:hypothetical protein
MLIGIQSQLKKYDITFDHSVLLKAVQGRSRLLDQKVPDFVVAQGR